MQLIQKWRPLGHPFLSFMFPHKDTTKYIKLNFGFHILDPLFWNIFLFPNLIYSKLYFLENVQIFKMLFLLFYNNKCEKKLYKCEKKSGRCKNQLSISYQIIWSTQMEDKILQLLGECWKLIQYILFSVKII